MTQETFKQQESLPNPLNIQYQDHIQPFGVLLVISKHDYIILQVSENIKDRSGISAEQILNHPISKFHDNPFLNEINQFLDQVKIKKSLFFEFFIKKDNYEILLHDHENFYILECIFYEQQKDSFESQKMMHCIDTLITELSLFSNYCKTGQYFVKKIKEALGFDKVMIYHFLEDEHIEVLAEASEPDMESYIGLRFPKSDEPPQMREMYLKNPFRIIYDCLSEPVKILPNINPITGNVLDLSSCLLKGVSSTYRQYTKNMNIRTSISRGIIVDGKLWGLISCHHKELKSLSYETRQSLSIFSYLFAHGYILYEYSEQSRLSHEQLSILSKLIELITQNDKNLIMVLANMSDDMMHIFNASGSAIYFDGQVIKKGITPTENEIKDLISWLIDQKSNEVYYCENLSKNYPPAQTYKNIACGLLALSLGIETRSYILWFRPEQNTHIKWGRYPYENPSEKLDIHEQKPKQSFSIWKEDVSGYSQKWTSAEINTADQIRKAVLQSMYRLQYIKRQIAETEIIKVRSAADKANEGIFTLNPSGYIEWMNQWFLNFFKIKNNFLETPLSFASLLEQNHIYPLSAIDQIKEAIIKKNNISLEIAFSEQNEQNTRNLLISLSPFKTEGNVEYKLIGTAADITPIKKIMVALQLQTEELSKANENLIKLNQQKHEAYVKLTIQTEELKKQTRRIELLSEMGELLQTCLSADEIYLTFSKYGEQLFPNFRGWLSIYDETKTQLQVVSWWGNAELKESLFSSSECWAIRKGQPTLLTDPLSMRCKHINPALGYYICMPLIAGGELFGVVSVVFGSNFPLHDELKILGRLVGDMAFAIANIRLVHSLKSLSIHDPLTNLYNRRYMEESFARELALAHRKNSSLSVIMIDIDYFKKLNDSYGHKIGDLVLQKISLFLKNYFRDTDIICRFGGEEFIVILPETNIEVALEKAETLRKEAQKLNIQVTPKSLYLPSFSLGVAAFPEHGETLESLIRAVDIALYRAKEEGRNCVRMASLH